MGQRRGFIGESFSPVGVQIVVVIVTTADVFGFVAPLGVLVEDRAEGATPQMGDVERIRAGEEGAAVLGRAEDLVAEVDGTDEVVSVLGEAPRPRHVIVRPDADPLRGLEHQEARALVFGGHAVLAGDELVAVVLDGVVAVQTRARISAFGSLQLVAVTAFHAVREDAFAAADKDLHAENYQHQY